MKMKLIIPALMAAAAMSSHAAVVATSAFNTTSRTFYSVNSSDLIQNGAATLSSGPTVSSGSFTEFDSANGANSFALANLNDGTNSNITGSAFSTGYDNTAVDTFNYATDFVLNTTTNTLGYDLTSITVTSNGNDRRVNQNIEIFYTTVANPTFQLLKAYTFTPATASSSNYSLRVNVTEDAGNNILATGVNAVRFRVLTPAAGYATSTGGTVFSEFDVAGIATVPEPTTALLSALGCLALLRRRR